MPRLHASRLALTVAITAASTVSLVAPAPAAAGDDPRSDVTRAHQACLVRAWSGEGAACFRRWLAAYEDDASPAERARARKVVDAGDGSGRPLDGAALLTVRGAEGRDVWIDGEPLGRAPLLAIPVTPGAHRIEVSTVGGASLVRDVILFADQEDLVELDDVRGGGPESTRPSSPGRRGDEDVDRGADDDRDAGAAAGQDGAPAARPVATTTGAVFDFCAPKDGLSRPRVLMLAPSGGEELERTPDLANVGAAEQAREVFVARFPLQRFENVGALAPGDAGWLDLQSLPVSTVAEHLEARVETLEDDSLEAREARFAAYSAACTDDLVVPAITGHTFEWVVTKVKDKKGRTTTVRTAKLEMKAALAIFRRRGDRFERVAKLDASAPTFADTMSDLAMAAMPTTGVAGMDTLELVSAAADASTHLSAVPDAACLALHAPREGAEAILRCAKQGAGRVELAAKAVDERLGAACKEAREGGGDPAIVRCEVRARTFQLTRSLKKDARGVEGWRLAAPLATSRGDDVLALGEKEGLEVGYGFVAVDAEGERVGYYKVTEVGEGGRPSRVAARAGSAPQGTILQEYPQMGLTLGTLGFAHGVLLNDAPTLLGDVPVGPAPWVAGGLLEVGYDLSGALGAVETHLRIDVGFGGGPGVNANSFIVPTDVWIEKGFYLGDRVTMFGAIGGGFQYVIVQIVPNPGVLEQTLSAYGGGPAARAGLGIQLHPDVELRLEGIGRGSVVPASYEPSEDGESLPVGWSAREDRWLMLGGRAGLGVIL